MNARRAHSFVAHSFEAHERTGRKTELSAAAENIKQQPGRPGGRPMACATTLYNYG
jgi:hypothetical protein